MGETHYLGLCPFFDQSMGEFTPRRYLTIAQLFLLTHMDRGITLSTHQDKHNLKNSLEPQTNFSLLGSNATKVIDFLLFLLKTFYV